VALKVYHSLEEIKEKHSPSGVAIGNFDGVHLGHQSLIRTLVEKAKEENLVPSVLTFYPHPVEVLNPAKKVERITTTSEKLELLEALGVETVVVAPFDSNVARLSPEEFFAKYLLDSFQARRVHVGSGFQFGKDRAGDVSALEKLAAKVGCKVSVEPPFEMAGERVSSSGIREHVRNGLVKEARIRLGRPYTVSGSVKKGDQRGRQLGYPTANLDFPAEKLFPKNGVYVTIVDWQRQRFSSVCNVGVRPTFHGAEAQRVIEVHILDFQQRLYDEVLKVEFLDRLRDEKKFGSLEELKEQIARDVERARCINPI
jgi:riboflavin kinase / FMN adenylyltransferase